MNLESWIIFIVVGSLIVYKLYDMFGYWLNPFHRHKMNRTLEEYFEHIKLEHPDIWKEHKLTDISVEEFIKKVREKENESR